MKSLSAASCSASSGSSPLAGLSQEQRDRLSALLDQYLSSREQGAPLDQRQLLTDHPDLAAAMELYFRSLEDLHALAAGCGGDATNVHCRPGFTDDCARRLGDFELFEELGRGGMGVVYRARQLSLDRLVALKVLPFAAVLDARQVARFKHEAQAAAQLHHSHIVPVYAIGVERGVHYYAMQLVEGQSLDRALAGLRERRGHDRNERASAFSLLPANRGEYVRSIIRLGIQAAEALHAAHEFGIVHRDVKPSNLLIDAAGKLWVTDFGLARFQRDTSLTRTGDLVGTLRYMSPEQAAGRTTLVDQRTDVYSLGATLYEMLALRPAFIEQDGAALAQQIENHDPPRLRSIRSDIPVDLETVITKAISKDREQRYATAQEFARDLDCVLSGKLTIARPPSIRSATARWVRRHSRLMVASTTTLAMLLLTLATTVALVSREKARAEHHLARADQYWSDTREVIDRFGVALAQQLADRPDASAMRRGLLQETRQRYERYFADARQNPALLAELAVSYGKLATQIEKLGTAEESLAAHRASSELFEQLVALDGRNLDYQTHYAISQNNVGLALARMGEPRVADEHYQKAIQRFERVLERSPHHQQALEGLAKSLGNRGLLFHETGQMAEAIAALEKSLGLLERMHTTDEMLPRQRALALKTLASLRLRGRQYAVAASLYDKALAIERDLLAASPLNVTLASDLAITENNIGLLHSRRGDWNEAEGAFARSIEIQQRLVKQSPGDVALRSNLAGAHSNLAVVFERTGRMHEAVAHFTAATEHQRYAATAAPEVTRYGQLLAAHLANQTRLSAPSSASTVEYAHAP